MRRQQVPHLTNDAADVIRFGEKLAAGGKTGRIGQPFSRGDQNRNPGPALQDQGGEFKSAHAAGHFDVGEQEAGFGPSGLEEIECLAGVPCFHDFEASLGQRVGGGHADQRFILGDEDDGMAGHDVEVGI